MSAGLIRGNKRGFDPLKPLTRIEAAAILVRALVYENEPTEAVSKFGDIPDGNLGIKYANIAAEKGISLGVGDGRFDPDALVTDNKFAMFVLRSADEPKFDWEQAMSVLIEKGIVTE